MGGNIKNKMGNVKLSEQQKAALEAAQKEKEKKSLMIRAVIAVAVFVAAAAACVFMLKHDFNADLELLHGTYYAQQRFGTGGSDVSNVDSEFVVTFYDDGRMIFKYEKSSDTFYYELDEDVEMPYSGKILRYDEGVFKDEIYFVRRDNGDFMMYYDTDKITFTVPRLVKCFGEDGALAMMSGSYDEAVCRKLIAGDYDSLTDEEVAALGVEREKLSEIAFSVKNLPTVTMMNKLTDEEISKAKALEIWAEMNPVSESDAVSGTDQ